MIQLEFSEDTLRQIQYHRKYHPHLAKVPQCTSLANLSDSWDNRQYVTRVLSRVSRGKTREMFGTPVLPAEKPVG